MTWLSEPGGKTTPGEEKMQIEEAPPSSSDEEEIAPPPGQERAKRRQLRREKKQCEDQHLCLAISLIIWSVSVWGVYMAVKHPPVVLPFCDLPGYVVVSGLQCTPNSSLMAANLTRTDTSLILSQLILFSISLTCTSILSTMFLRVVVIYWRRRFFS